MVFSGVANWYCYWKSCIARASTIEIEILIFRVCFGDRTPVRPENKQINVSDSSFLCHLKIVKASQQNAICSIIKARWGPCIRFRKKSCFCLFLCNEGLLAGPFVQLVTFCKVFGKLTGVRASAKCCKPNTLPDRYEDCYDEPIFWSSYDIRKSISCTKGAYYPTGFQTFGCLALGSFGCIKKLRCCMMVLGESPC